METSTVDAAAIWTGFAAQSWGKAPIVLKTLPLATPSEAFQALITMCNAYRAGEPEPTSESLRLAVQHRKLEADVHRHLPSAEDASGADYAARLERDLQSRTFFIYARDIQVFSPLLWDRARDLLGALFDQIGIPAGHVELELFFGRYEFTTGGIHRESCSNLHCVLDGHKRMHIWPKDAWSDSSAMNRAEAYAGYLDAADIGRHIGGATTLDGRAGDILYWPAAAWHVGEAPQLSLCMNIAIYMEGQPSDLAAGIVSKLVAARLGQDAQLISYPLSQGCSLGGETLPGALEKTLLSLRQMGSESALAGAVAAEWLKRKTGFGFERPPRRAPSRAIPANATVRGSRKYRVLWMEAGDKELVFAANGHASTAPSRPGVVGLIERLNRGEPAQVSDLLRDDPSPNELQAILGELLTMRAVTLC